MWPETVSSTPEVDCRSVKADLTAIPKANIPSYNRGSRLFPLAGLVLGFFLGTTLIGTGIYIYVFSASQKNEIYGNYWYSNTRWSAKEERVAIYATFAAWCRPFIYLAVSVGITICTEATGYVQSTTLKWSLAREGRLEYNANVRLLQSAKGAFSVNGWALNTISALALILSYATSSVLFLAGTGTSLDQYLPRGFLLVFYFPLIILGVAFMVQALVGLVAFIQTDVPTWSSNPLDVAAALVHHGLAHPAPKHSGHSNTTYSITNTDPIHPSLWTSHRVVRRVVCLLWALIPIGFLWGGAILATCRRQEIDDEAAIIASYGQYNTSVGGSRVWLLWHVMSPAESVLWTIVIIASVQSVLTMSLHCCELVVLLARDEATYRSAKCSSGEGLGRESGSPLRMALGSWQTLGLLVFKPVLHWLFGNAIDAGNGQGFYMDALWIFFLSTAMVPLAGFVTFVATRRPRGPRPATYGHIQTLVNLLAEPSTTSPWAEKAEEVFGGADISCDSLPSPYTDIERPAYKDITKPSQAFNSFLRSFKSPRDVINIPNARPVIKL